MDALRSHGHQEAALRLAVAVVRTMKQQQLVDQRKWHELQKNYQGPSTSTATTYHSSPHSKHHYCRNLGHSQNGEKTLHGFSLDPVITLFDTLVEASLPPDAPSKSTTFYGKCLFVNFLTGYKFHTQEFH